MELEFARDLSVLLNAVGVGNSFLLAFFYLSQKQGREREPSTILFMLFFVLGSVILNTIFNFTGYSNFFPAFEPLTNALSFAIAPLLYLYIRSYRSDDPNANLKSPHLWYFYGYGVFTLLVVVLEDSNFALFGQALIESQWLLFFWNLHFLAYIVGLHREFRSAYTKNLEAPRIIVWSVISIWFFNLLLYLYRVFVDSLSIHIYLNITLFFTAMTVWLLHNKFKDGPIYGQKRTRNATEISTLLNSEKEPIIKALTTHKYYRDPQLNIRKLSRQLDMPYHELSEIINHKYGQNFNKFINAFRVQEVVEALESEQHQAYTIMGLAQKAGFRSASSFYAAFKKEKGTTPSDFLERLG